MKVDGLPLDVQLAAAVTRKLGQVAKQQGQAAVALIETAAAGPSAPTADGRGQLVSTKA